MRDVRPEFPVVIIIIYNANRQYLIEMRIIFHVRSSQNDVILFENVFLPPVYIIIMHSVF